MRRFLHLAAAVTFLAASAADALAYDAREIRSEYVANRTINTATQIDKSWTPTNSGNGVRVGKNFTMAAPGGRTVAAEASVLLTRGAVMRLAAGAIPLLGVASLAYDVYDAYRIHAAGVGPAPGECTAASLLCFDPGAAQEMQSAFVGLGGALGGQCSLSSGSTLSAAHSVHVACAVGYWSGQFPLYSVSVGKPDTCDAQTLVCGGGYLSVLYPGGGEVTKVSTSNTYTLSQAPACPDSTGPAPGYDGRCATGEYTQPLTAEEAAAIATAHANAPIPDLEALTREALGVVPLPIGDINDVEVGNVVPMSLEGPVKTTTKVENGQTVVQTEATGWDWSRDPLRKMEGKWNATTTRTKTANGEVVSEETETEEGATPGDQTDAVNQCKLNPNSVGCAELGEAPTAGTIPTVSVPASMDERVTFGADTAACPADRVMNTSLAGALSFSWSGACMYADGIRPAVVGMAYLAAVLSFIGLGRRE